MSGGNLGTSWTHRILQPWLGLGMGQGCPSCWKSATPGIMERHKTTLKHRWGVQRVNCRRQQGQSWAELPLSSLL